MTAPPPPRPSGQLRHPPIWHAHYRTPVCRYGHPQIDVRDKSMVVERRGPHFVFQTCRTCTPHTHAFGVVIVEPTPMTFYYDCTRAQLDAVLALPLTADAFTILRLLGYAPAPDEE